MKQMMAVECGAACLAMILNYYGRSISISEVQERCGVGRDGLSALAIVKAARQYGLRVRAISLKKNDFHNVALPAIVHWEFNHFVIVERWSRTHVDLVDPAVGRRRLSAEEFDEGFTGVVITLEPGAQFERRSSQSSLTLWSYMRSLLQMRGVVIQILASSLLLQVLGLGAPLLTAVVVDYIIPTKSTSMLMLFGLGMLLLVITQGATKLLRASLLIYLQTHIDARMMLNFFEHLLSLPYRFFQMRLNGDLLARVQSNIAIRDLLSNQMISTMLDGSTILVYLAVLIAQSRLVAGTTLVIGALQVGLLLLTAPAIRRLTRRDLAAQGKTQGYMNEILAGIATVKAAGAEQRVLDRWTNLFFDEMNISVRRNYLMSVISIILEIIYVLSPLLLLWLGALQVMAGNMSMGTMLALNTLAASFLLPLNSLASSGQMIQVARAHFERIADVIGAEPEQDPQQVQIPPQLTGRIELRNVSFQYDPNTPPILNDISVKIRPGQKVALVGRTGSGKSTLGKLLIGLMTPSKGNILFDGIPLQHMNYQELRRQLGVVLQESFIFSGSVRENIAFNNPALGMEQVVEAAKAAAIHEDIEAMPMGYETLLSEGGSVFSGGQRQRLALARALANQPAVLLLDEATSALDVATERAVEQNVNSLSCTQVVIAHRLSTIRNADLILVLDQGRIVEQGTHELLLRRDGFYARLIKAQVESGEIVAA
ncbi:NHLP family bacteriocin export ABC transporter peptidase/permease/ATPase [Reticulibacter mediterranei]|uniref:NHLP family bacteriocin export ABC transporter peptidase/permease/ATPase n=2 Tax=Reticulibacter mediterranei TaxID=2778369 RepID=A0A8J3IJF7_9CHLR|nr:NHLP family bacteriocin export ABC transporter peptidase/permease/ATPase [Reticulibacter mediterranei]